MGGGGGGGGSYRFKSVQISATGARLLCVYDTADSYMSSLVLGQYCVSNCVERCSSWAGGGGGYVMSACLLSLCIICCYGDRCALKNITMRSITYSAVRARECLLGLFISPFTTETCRILYDIYAFAFLC